MIKNENCCYYYAFKPINKIFDVKKTKRRKIESI